LKHLAAGKQVWEYLHNTKDLIFLIHPFDKLLQVDTAVCDATWGDDKENQKSTSGGLVFIAGTPIWSWTTQQSFIATSSAVSEYYSLSECVDHIAYARNFLQGFGYQQLNATTIFTDSTAAEDIAKTTKNFSSTKAVEIRYHNTRFAILQSKVKIQHIDSTNNVADFFTKPNGNPNYTRFRTFNGVTTQGGVRNDSTENDYHILGVLYTSLKYHKYSGNNQHEDRNNKDHEIRNNTYHEDH
jgi:hypothetical protein